MVRGWGVQGIQALKSDIDIFCQALKSKKQICFPSAINSDLKCSTITADYTFTLHYLAPVSKDANGESAPKHTITENI